MLLEEEEEEEREEGEEDKAKRDDGSLFARKEPPLLSSGPKPILRWASSLVTSCNPCANPTRQEEVANASKQTGRIAGSIFEERDPVLLFPKKRQSVPPGGGSRLSPHRGGG